MSATVEQRRRNLERANEVRRARAELRRRIARGEIFAASVLLEPPAEARTWAVADILLAQRRWLNTRSEALATPPLANEAGGRSLRCRRDFAPGSFRRPSNYASASSSGSACVTSGPY